MRFWLEKRPIDDGWFYSVEMYGVTHQFTKFGYLAELRDKLSGTRKKAIKELVVKPLKSFLYRTKIVHGKLRWLQHLSRETYIFLRHQKEIAGFLDIAHERPGELEKQSPPEL